MADKRSLLRSRRLTEKELLQNARLSRLANLQKTSRSALEGELGVFANPDGTFSTERSSTIEMDGKFFNIPMLVKGQSKEAVGRILSGNPSKKDVDVAAKRARERAKKGQELPSFNSLQEAIAAAEARSGDK